MNKVAVSVVALVIIALGASYFFVQETPQASQVDESIKIGTIFSQTGFASAFGEMTYKGVMLAVEEINQNGGINGKKIVVVSEDDRTDGKVAIGAYKKLTSIDNVDAIVGGNFDFVSQPLFDLAKVSETVIVAPMNSRTPNSLETNGNSFVMLIDFPDIIKTLDPYLANTEYNKLAVIHYASGFGNQIAKTLGEVSIAHGKGDVVDEVYQQLGSTDWKPYILRLKQQGVDMVFADMLQDDFVRFVDDAKRLGFQATFMTHNDIRNALTRKDVNLSLLDGVIVLNWDVLGSDSFIKKFKDTYGIAPVNYASQAYVATYIVAEGLSKNGKDGLSKYLETTKFETPEGEYSFNENHAVSYTPIKIQVIKNGELVEWK